MDVIYNSTTDVIRGIRFRFSNGSETGIGENEDSYNHSTCSFNYTGSGVLSYFKIYMRGSEMVKLEAFWMSKFPSALAITPQPPPLSPSGAVLFHLLPPLSWHIFFTPSGVRDVFYIVTFYNKLQIEIEGHKKHRRDRLYHKFYCILQKLKNPEKIFKKLKCCFRTSSTLEHLDSEREGPFKWILQRIFLWYEQISVPVRSSNMFLTYACLTIVPL